METAFCCNRQSHAIPRWVRDALSQAIASVRGEQLPITILHEKGKRYDNALVVMRLADFIAWHGDVALPAEALPSTGKEA